MRNHCLALQRQTHTVTHTHTAFSQLYGLNMSKIKIKIRFYKKAFCHSEVSAKIVCISF